MSQTDGQTDGQTTSDSKTVLCTIVHRAVKTYLQHTPGTASTGLTYQQHMMSALHSILFIQGHFAQLCIDIACSSSSLSFKDQKIEIFLTTELQELEQAPTS